MKARPIHASSLWILLGIAVVLIFFSSNINWQASRWQLIVRSDGKGYYAYLPAVFIYHDLNFGFFEQVEQGTHYHPLTFQDYRADHHGHTINQYFAGVALLQTPFFLLAHGLTKLSGGPADGYSKLYFYLFHLGAIAYVMLGAACVLMWLREWGISAAAARIAVLAIVFGTNLYYYITCEPGMSHVYTFGLAGVWVWLAHRFFRRDQARLLPWLGLVFGLIILVRPVNGLVICSLPLLARSAATFVGGVRRAMNSGILLVAGVSLAIGIPSLQLLIYKLQTGDFWVYSYGSAIFDFAHPHFWDILFSYHKGLFVYTPLCLLALAGLVPLYRRAAFATLSWVLFMLLVVYVLSSWEFWDYGGSFSSRPFIDYYAFFALPLGAALGYFPYRWLRNSYLVCVLALVVVCQIQTYQYRYLRIDVNHMTKEKYWDEFLRIDRIILNK
ncbi:MAG: hypothetical protein OHK0039_25270 [Bacteroidia bacterium]